MQDPNHAMDGLLSALSVAFDTTALALVLSISLMFAMFLVGQAETRLLSDINQLAQDALAGRFRVQGSGRDPQVALLRQLGQQIIANTEQLVARQAAIWRESFEVASQHWLSAANDSQQQIESGLSQALQNSLREHSQRLAEMHTLSEQRMGQRWHEMQGSLQQHIDVLRQQQQALGQQGETMRRVLEATGDVIKLEHALNRNLKALASAKNFEDTVISLSAAIQLLTTRVGGVPNRLALGSSESLAEEKAA